jgi:hypothetical protein
MSEVNREIQELLVDYAGALRDGCLPAFLKSLTREEAKRIDSSREFWENAEVWRTLNSAGFAGKAVAPDVGLFTSRVDAKIGSRLKKARASSSKKRTTGTKYTSKPERKTEKSI